MLWRNLMVFFTLLAPLGGCNLPPLDNRSTASALDQVETLETPLGRAVAPRARANPKKSGIHALSDPHDAFAARALLARAAEKTLDVQYYIWHGDITGTLLFDELRAAAERGVRVRLLLDDNGTSGVDTELAALNSHSNIEIRLFNPFVFRKAKAIGYVTNFMRANRRMHNKSFTADSQASIIGGRNVGDEYFGATEGILFADLDVLAVGPVVADVSTDFDRYWASGSSYPVDLILPPAVGSALTSVAAAAKKTAESPAAAEYIRAIRDSGFITGLLEGKLDFEWADTRMVSDDPAKGLGKAVPSELMIHQLGGILGSPQSHVELVSPYFVPTTEGVDVFTGMAKRGVSVRVLTNSLDATDVAAVHAGYAKRRKALLKGGVVLYEMRRLASGNKRNESAGAFGSSGSSLHAKTFAVDQARVYIGSFNFDPRSANLNTELGFVIESPTMADAIEKAFDESIPLSAYEVRLSSGGQIYWIENRDGEEVRHDSEPETGFWKRTAVSLLSILPIEWML
ncbi:phospholipase D family protein [Stutzerimonas stutzeri]|uniref:phospholipase D family protein n=1 Tax=Stutzerimonas stutzeri TaxID=316 RepID=UPI002109EAEB|nr:phospholipase D family protein [Stutzerimonas stutzeri]MCQ4322090.1 phospholipase D family protein [Stutzerimonas stutzeri]